MVSKFFFENEFQNYSSETAHFFLDDKKNALSENFLGKLTNFKNEKLLHLTTELNKDLFHDGTVYTGSAGLALYYLMFSLNGKNVSHDMLQLALNYIDINNLKGRRISFLCGDAGPLAIATVISYKFGNGRPDNLPDYHNLVKRLINLSTLVQESPDELLYGRVGYLYALLFVNKYIGEKNGVSANNIEKVISSVLKSGKQFSQQMKSESPLLWQWHDKIYLGAAHGISGILYVLLQGRSYINAEEIRSFIKPTLDWLLKQRFPSGNFPSSLKSSSGDRLVQWCHGAPGFVPLCLLAYQIFHEEKYLNIAIQCGDVIWQRGLCAKGFSICHGVAGNAYAFLQLYQVTKKAVYLYRACCFVEWCACGRAGSELRRPDRPASLFEGLLGRIYLAADIVNPMEAKFPAFCL
ncbi:glutathione S-transferase LANCL1-like isoform X1 [Vanessa atalanta]|uniref:glutathione S-transferase LANCL1-like isoform X1 n=2 Tax=Vanessa atalanta TaxID=42275 RepID=UPI001FCCF133|nr:glutathione S-transferase LANCL1-like isoform X1 [Vanessa atalanta]